MGAEVKGLMKDRVGLSWRPQLAAGILANLEKIDLVEVIADDYFQAPRAQVRALRTLAKLVPVVLHGVSLGPASSIPVKAGLLDLMARLVDILGPESWSEHLAFVRADGWEIGHLAVPPRTAATVEGTARNLSQARRVIGAWPLVENVATLIDPPGSDLDELTWITQILASTDADMLLDLHNVYANAMNFGFDPMQFVKCLPMERVGAIHLAGGKWINGSSTGDPRYRRLLDDHLHDVPEPVLGLLSEVAARTARPLTVILERDGEYPPIEVLLNQLERARRAIADGRGQRVGIGKNGSE